MLNQDISRRRFLKQSAVVTAGSFLLPSFLKANPLSLNNGKRLVVIQLSGGNDGLNTIIPYRNEILESVRPGLFLGREKVLQLNDEIGVNPAMEGLNKIYDQGDVCILNSVGYPNPNRSHFRSMDIWHTASDSDEYVSSGWLGRYLDNECTDEDNITGIEMGNILSMSMKGEKRKGVPLTNINQFYNSSRMINTPEAKDHANEMVDFLYKSQADIKSSAKYLYEKNKIYKSSKTYPNNSFGKELKEVAEMIISGVEAPIYYVSLSGFDTHNNQRGRQDRLLKIYSEALSVFADDLKQNDRWNDTLVMTFSEFGRRVKQNASNGTDHGKANNLLLMGGSLKKNGIYNEMPDLSNLDDGDVSHSIDFRNVYATIIDRWLESDSTSILGRSFSNLQFI
ncbi:DUF1501 domain-containing protein [Ekhidna sp.]